MNHLTYFTVPLAFCALVAVRIIIRALASTEKLKKEARLAELLPKLLPYSYAGDRARLLGEMGSVSSLRALGRAMRATSALIERAGGSGRIQKQTRNWAMQGRWAIRAAMVEVVLRKLYPAWQSMFLLAAVQIYDELGVTYEALINTV